VRVKVLRNIGIQTVREFAEKGLELPQYREGQVVEADDKVAEALFARGLAEQSNAEVTKTEFPGPRDQPPDDPLHELSRPAAGTGHEPEGGDRDPKKVEPGRQAGSSSPTPNPTGNVDQNKGKKS
jgi:hypothetical protein